MRQGLTRPQTNADSQEIYVFGKPEYVQGWAVALQGSFIGFRQYKKRLHVNCHSART